jgi:hypothetical protein
MASSQNFGNDDSTVWWSNDIGVGSNGGVLMSLCSAWGLSALGITETARLGQKDKLGLGVRGCRNSESWRCYLYSGIDLHVKEMDSTQYARRI